MPAFEPAHRRSDPGQPGRDARARTIEAHLPLVRSIARRYAGHGEPLEDLVQVGAVGLIKAVDRFEPDRGVALSTFAAPSIEGEIRHHLRDRGSLLRAPRPVRELDARLRAAEPDLARSLGRAPSRGELAGATGASEAAVDEAIAARARAAAQPLREIEDPSARPDQAEARLLLVDGWQVLGERERRILHLRFYDDLTQAQIARDVGLSQAHVSRLIRDALEHLRASLRDGVAEEDGAAYSPPEMASPASQGEQRSSHSGRLLIRMPQSLHDELAETAEREGVSLNTFITGVLASAMGWRDGAPGAADDESVPPENGSRRQWLPIALVANLVVVALAAAVALILLVTALAQGA